MHSRQRPRFARPYGPQPRSGFRGPLQPVAAPWRPSLGLVSPFLVVLGVVILLGSVGLAGFTVLAARFMWALVTLPPIPA